MPDFMAEGNEISALIFDICCCIIMHYMENPFETELTTYNIRVRYECIKQFLYKLLLKLAPSKKKLIN